MATVKTNNKTTRQTKKPTAAQLERRLNNAIIHVDKTKYTKSVYFDDKGLRLTVDTTQGVALVETNYHRHVFFNITAQGYSRPFMYIMRFVDIALNNDCTTKDENGDTTRSLARLFDVLKAKEDQTEYRIAWFCDLWFFNIFSPLYEIDETEAGSFLVYERYMHNIARQSFLLDEHKEDVTNKMFVNTVLDIEKSFLENLDESVIIKGRTDEERMQEEIDAIQEQQIDDTLKEQGDDKQ